MCPSSPSASTMPRMAPAVRFCAGQRLLVDIALLEDAERLLDERHVQARRGAGGVLGAPAGPASGRAAWPAGAGARPRPPGAPRAPAVGAAATARPRRPDRARTGKATAWDRTRPSRRHHRPPRSDVQGRAARGWLGTTPVDRSWRSAARVRPDSWTTLLPILGSRPTVRISPEGPSKRNRRGWSASHLGAISPVPPGPSMSRGLVPDRGDRGRSTLVRPACAMAELARPDGVSRELAQASSRLVLR